MNRFIEMDQYLKRTGKCHPGHHGKHGHKRSQAAPAATGASQSMSVYAQPFAATDRALVILIENGGIDLGIPVLVEKILSALPGANLIPDSFKAKLVDTIRDKIKSFTDTLLESAELAANRFSAASPSLYNEVAVLRDGTASYNDLKGKLIALTQAQKIIDLYILTHGSDDYISVAGGINSAKIRQIRDDFGRPLSIRSVYMMNCVGSTLNKAWLYAGAKTSCGTVKNNYLPEPTMHFFWQNWKAGQTFQNAATSAYQKTIRVMNETVRGFISAIPIPGTSLLAGRVDFSKYGFVTDSAPMVEGDGNTITISSDSLSFTKSVSSGMAVTVLPVPALQSLGMSYAASAGEGVVLSHSYSYHSPSLIMQHSEYSLQQNPAALVIAGIEVADAAQIGLAAVGMVQAQVAASQGTFTLVYDKAQRLLTSAARAKMPGSMSSKKSYRYNLLQFGISRPGTAEALVVIEWEGNAYGEISTAIIQRDLDKSTEWSHSSAGITITRTERIPIPNSDPRAWPIVYTYIGSYDPVGNGQWEFNGEFEINAFGGLKFNSHHVVSRSLADWALSGKPEDYVRKGRDVIVAVPAVPKEQEDYLKTALP